MSGQKLSVRPMHVGAEVVGDFSGIATSEDGKRELFDAWMTYGLLLFRGIESSEQHLALSRCFGQLEEHPIPEARAAENALFMKVGAESEDAFFYDDSSFPRVGTVGWHRDTAYTVDIAKGAMLRLLENPATDGNTLFADMAMAYDDLPVDLRNKIDSLEWRTEWRASPVDQPVTGALWKTVRPATGDELEGTGIKVSKLPDRQAQSERFPAVVHPAVLVHPDSGRRCIFLSPKEFDCFLGVSAEESNELFERITEHMLAKKYVYKHDWHVNDAMLWDNRRFMHAAEGNRVGDRRKGLRTTLAGDLRVGRMFADVSQN